MPERYRREIRFWGRSLDRDADDELRFHIEMRTAELMERGSSEADARAEAVRAFGSLPAVKAEVRHIDRQTARHVRWTTWLADLRQDVVAGLRQFRKAPGFTAAAVLTISLGVGATTAIFGVVHAVVLRPLPFPEPDRIAFVTEFWRDQPSDVSVGNFVDWRAGSTGVFSHLAAINYTNLNVADGSEPERVLAGQVSRGFFELFGMAPLHGRVLRADEDSPGKGGVVVLSHGFFVQRFAADPSVVGRAIRLNGRPHVVVGVMPKAFDYLADNGALWVPAAFTAEQEAEHDEHYLTVFGRLAPGVTWAQAEDRLVAVARDLEKRYPQDNAGITARVSPYTEWLVQDVRLRLFTWLGAVACVLLIACANVANLLLARGTGRARELAVRASLGASRWRIVRQLLAESLVLSAAGAAGGVAIASWATQLLAVAGPASLPRIFQASVDGAVLAFAVALTIASAVIFGLVPALRAARTDLQGVMREGGRRSGSGVARDRMRTALVAAEVALAVTLIVGAGLLLRAAWQLQRVALGFEPAGVLTARVTLPDAAYPTGERVLQAFDAMVERLRATPGVTAAGFTSQVPMGPGGNGNGLLPTGRPLSPENLISSRLRIVSLGYLETMRVPLQRGRHFTAADRRGAPRVMIISASLARAAWPGQDPIGRQMQCCEGSEGDPRDKTVIGVVGDVRSSGPAGEVQHEFYLPAAQAPEESWSWIQRTLTLAVRGPGDAAALSAPIRASVRAVDPALPLHNVRTMSERLSRSLASNRFNTQLVGTLGLMALVLAAIGIYSVIAYFVTQRTHEIGIRLALGATPAQVVRLVVRQAMGPVALGLAAGVVGAVLAARLLQSQLGEVSTADPLAFSAGVALLAAVAIGASVLPARRASRVQPRLLVDG
jgi:putative ABC transport system permease protein